MRFQAQEIPGSVFAFARNKMLELEHFTPAEMRELIIAGAAPELQALSIIATNRRNIADRVMRECIKQLVAAGQLVSEKRGVWSKSTPPADAAAAAASPASPSEAPGGLS
jgi:hypothetical protein